MHVLHIASILIAIILFILASIPKVSAPVNFQPLGLVFFALSFLLP